MGYHHSIYWIVGVHLVGSCSWKAGGLRLQTAPNVVDSTWTHAMQESTGYGVTWKEQGIVASQPNPPSNVPPPEIKI